MACSSTYDHYSQVFSRRVFLCVFCFFVSGQSFRLRRPRTMRQTVGSWMFLQVRLVNRKYPQDFSNLFFSRQALPKSFLCFAITWNLNFAVNLLTSFSRQKTVKIEKQKRYDFLEYKVLPPYKVWVQTNKIWKRSSCRDTTTIQVEGHNQPCCMEVSRWREAK